MKKSLSIAVVLLVMVGVLVNTVGAGKKILPNEVIMVSDVQNVGSKVVANWKWHDGEDFVPVSIRYIYRLAVESTSERIGAPTAPSYLIIDNLISDEALTRSQFEILKPTIITILHQLPPDEVRSSLETQKKAIEAAENIQLRALLTKYEELARMLKMDPSEVDDARLREILNEYEVTALTHATDKIIDDMNKLTPDLETSEFFIKKNYPVCMFVDFIDELLAAV